LLYGQRAERTGITVMLHLLLAALHVKFSTMWNVITNSPFDLVLRETTKNLYPCFLMHTAVQSALRRSTAGNLTIILIKLVFFSIVKTT
jgi:hypothetical protein